MNFSPKRSKCRNFLLKKEQTPFLRHSKIKDYSMKIFFKIVISNIADLLQCHLIAIVTLSNTRINEHMTLHFTELFSRSLLKSGSKAAIIYVSYYLIDTHKCIKSKKMK